MPRRRRGLLLAGALAASALAGCVGNIGDRDEGTPGEGQAPLCAVPPMPLRRLTRVQYDNAVRDLLGLAAPSTVLESLD